VPSTPPDVTVWTSTRWFAPSEPFQTTVACPVDESTATRGMSASESEADTMNAEPKDADAVAGTINASSRSRPTARIARR